MNKINKGLVRFFMFAKRLLVTPSFIALLCIIPIIIPIAKTAITSDKSLARIVLCAEDDSPATAEIINSLTKKEDGTIVFTTADSSAEAIEEVENNKADGAWIFYSGFEEKLTDYVQKDNPLIKNYPSLVRVVEREETIPLKLSHEMLYGALYRYISFELCKDFIYSEIDREQAVPESAIEDKYFGAERLDDIIEVEVLNKKIEESGASMMTTPIRGLLSVVCVLCTTAAAMYFLKDEKEGRYDRLAPHKHIYPAFALTLAASLLSCFAVFIALHFSGLTTGFISELAAILMFAAAETGFCLVLCMLFNSAGKLGAMIPGLVAAMLVLSPVFFNLRELKVLGMMFPTYYYLNGIYDSSYLVSLALYTVTVYALAFVLAYLFKSKRINREKLI